MPLKDEHVSFISPDRRCLCLKKRQVVRAQRKLCQSFAVITVLLELEGKKKSFALPSPENGLESPGYLNVSRTAK